MSTNTRKKPYSLKYIQYNNMIIDVDILYF